MADLHSQRSFPEVNGRVLAFWRSSRRISKERLAGRNCPGESVIEIALICRRDLAGWRGQGGHQCVPVC